MKNNISLKIAEYLRIIREKNNFSYGVLSQKSKISKSVLHSLEMSKISPTVRTLEKILSCYDKTLLDLFKHVYEEK